MSDSPDLTVLSDLLQDLSVEFRRVSLRRQDGEPRASREEGRGAECVRTHGAASSARNSAAPSGEGASPTSDAVSPGPERRSGSPRGSATGALNYRAAVRGPATCLVTPLSGRVARMAAAGGGAPGPGPIQQAIAGMTTQLQFDNFYGTLPNDAARRSAENFGSVSAHAEVRLAAMIAKSAYQDREIRALATAVNNANNAAQQATQAAANAQAVAQAAGNRERWGPASPGKFGNKTKDPDIRQWLAIVEDYLSRAPDADYLRSASSYLEGGPRLLYMSRLEAYRNANAGANPPDAQARQWFRDTMEANYGLQNLEQKHWDTWNSLRMTSGMEFQEYVVQFQQALSDLADHVQDEQVKIEKFRGGLISDLREITRTSPMGTRWATLQELITYAGLQWPQVKERMSRRRIPAPAQKIAGKRKGAGGGGPSSRARLGAAAKSAGGGAKSGDSKEPPKCFICHSPDHVVKDCPKKKGRKSGNGRQAGRVAVAQASGEAMDEDFP